LVDKTCTPCRGDVPPLSREQVEPFLAQAPPHWRLDDARRIERGFKFNDFREALAFVDKGGALAENERHHPDIHFGWGHATVSLQTKKIKDLPCLMMRRSNAGPSIHWESHVQIKQ
jgi:4a-hydroxytetrahydrobiopterin dehydratase